MFRCCPQLQGSYTKILLKHEAVNSLRYTLICCDVSSAGADSKACTIAVTTNVWLRMFLVNYLQLNVSIKLLCKLPEDGDNAETYRS